MCFVIHHASLARLKLLLLLVSNFNSFAVYSEIDEGNRFIHAMFIGLSLGSRVASQLSLGILKVYIGTQIGFQVIWALEFTFIVVGVHSIVLRVLVTTITVGKSSLSCLQHFCKCPSLLFPPP